MRAPVLLSAGKRRAIAKQNIAILAAFSDRLAVLLPGGRRTRNPPASTTWAVSIVLPSKLVAGKLATLADPGRGGRLAEGITVNIGNGQR